MENGKDDVSRKLFEVRAHMCDIEQQIYKERTDTAENVNIMKHTNTLSLVLKKKWYDMIASGEKIEEYREIKPYWVKRLCVAHFVPSVFCFGSEYHCAYSNPDYPRMLKEGSRLGSDFKRFDDVTFHLGYAKNRPTMRFEIEDIAIREGNPEWGAEKDKRYFVIKLGKRL